jgi:hypothetical protein
MKKSRKKKPQQAQEISLRPVTPEDEALLYRVFAATRADEMARVPWSRAQKEQFLRAQFRAQREEYAARFGESGHKVVLLDGLPAGRIWVARDAEEIRLVDIAFLPEKRGAGGAGTTLIRGLMAEAEEAGKPLRMMALQFEEGPLQLYTQLGFRVVGESGVRYYLEWLPPALAPATQPSV